MPFMYLQQHPSNRISTYLYLLPACLLCWYLTGCGENKERIIAAKVSERVEDFKKKKREECRRDLLARAEKKVDSLLLAQAQESLQDSLGRIRPFRPTQPPAVPAIDSLAVKPLFGQ